MAILDGGTGYEPSFSLYSVIVIIVSIVKTLWRSDLSKEDEEEIFFALFRRIEGNYAESDDSSVFPSVHSNNESAQKHNFLEGTLLPLLAAQCPSVMDDLLSSLRTNPGHSRADFAAYCVAAGFAVGDGSFFCLHDGQEQPMLEYAIKDSERHTRTGDDPNAFKAFIEANFTGTITVSKKAVRRALNRDAFYDSTFFIASYFCLAFKAPQFFALCNLGWPLQLVQASAFGAFVKFCRKVFARLCSSLNIAHGVGIGKEFYDHQFQVMASSKISAICNYHGAGMFGSDGCIRLDGVHLCQSNKDYCDSFAEMCEREFGIRVKTSLCNGDNQSVNARAAFVVSFQGRNKALSAVHFGSLDYNRRTQWLVLVIACIIENTDIPNKVEVLAFLNKFMSYIKRIRKS